VFKFKIKILLSQYLALIEVGSDLNYKILDLSAKLFFPGIIISIIVRNFIVVHFIFSRRNLL